MSLPRRIKESSVRISSLKRSIIAPQKTKRTADGRALYVGSASGWFTKVQL